MEDEAPPSEVFTRRSKRVREHAQVAGEQPSNGNDIGGDSPEPSDQNPNYVDPDDSFDEYVETRPKAKRYRASEGTSIPFSIAGLSLIEAAKGNRKVIPQVVKVWVEKYEKDPKSAIVELLMMLFEACGANYHLNATFLDETDVDDVVVALVNLAREGEIVDYQNSKRKEFQSFKDNLVLFWDKLVIECQNGPLFDQVLFDKCMDYIIALSCTPPRIYRQVASLMGLQLVTSFITIAKMLGAQRETTQRQLNAEKKKQTEGPRVESLNKRLSMTHQKITVIEEMMRKIFTGLFVHRYRDVDPNIRMSCIQSLGVWIMSYPSLFLQDLYLKYLGWTLNDKSAGVRKASVLALQNLYEVDDNVPSLGLFTERFSNRMIELADDIDISVAVCAIGLVTQLLRHQLLSDDDLGPLYDLLIDDPPEIRRAIGALVYDHLIAQKFNSSQSSRKGNGSDSSEVHLGRMLQILREFSADPFLSIYVIDDVWEYMKAMTDWKCIISMLLDENPSIELTDEDATNLIRLFCASVKKAVGERIVPGTDNRKQYYNKAQKEVFDNNRRDITEAMMKNYPRLLRKYMADKANVPSLAEIILHMNLGLYPLKSREQDFEAVLQLMIEAFFKHGERDALRSCVKAIIFCSTESQGALQDFAQNKLKEIQDVLLTKLSSAIKEVVGGYDEYSLLVSSKRLYELQILRSVPIEISLYEEIATNLHNFRNMDGEVVSFLLLNMYFHVFWSLQSVLNSGTVSKESLSTLLFKRSILFEQLEYYLNPPPEVQEGDKYRNLSSRVCTLLAEGWYSFRKTNFSSKLEILGFCPDASVVQNFWKLCEQQLNIPDETEEDDVNKEYVEDTNKAAVMIAASKLVTGNVIPMDYLGPEIISHYVMHGPRVAEIVKFLISNLKKRNYDIPNIFLEALRRAFHRHMVDLFRSDDRSLADKSFVQCKNLASRLSGMFTGGPRTKYRLDVLKIVKGGIEYALVDTPRQLAFLEGALLHFVSKLPSPDVADVLRELQKRTEHINKDVDPSGWRPYHIFVDSLRDKYTRNESYRDEKLGTTVKRGRGRPRKQPDLKGKKLFEEESSSEEDDPISGSEQDEEEAPMTHPDKSLRSLRLPREGQTTATGVSGIAMDNNLATSMTSGAFN